MNVVCEQTILFAEHTGNFAQQSDLFAAAKAVCEDMIPYAEYTANSVPYPDFLMHSLLHFGSFLTAC